MILLQNWRLFFRPTVYLTGFGIFTSIVRAAIPIAGFPVPELSVLDTEMTTLMETNDITAGSLSLMRNDVIIFHHVYGWEDKEKLVPLKTKAIFRLASVTKPFTAVAIRKLIARGDLSLNSRVFSLGTPGTGVLDHIPFGTPDSRLKDITVDHLINHYGGWDLSIAGDLTFQETTIAGALSVPSPPGRDNTVRYIMGQPLQYDPGSTYAYSNIGYLLLGLIIEKVSEQSYQDFLQENVMRPSGTNSSEWLVGRTFKKDQDPREPFYDQQDLARNVFYPTFNDNFLVERPYGNFDFESLLAQGGIVAHGFVLLNLLNHYHVGGPEVGGPRPTVGTWRWSQIGSLPGTNTLASQRSDGINFAVMFNKRPASGVDYASAILTRIESVIDSGTITNWPTTDITQLVEPPPEIRVGIDAGSLFNETILGWEYQWQRSVDLITWENYREPLTGTGGDFTLPALTDELPQFYRLRAEE